MQQIYTKIDILLALERKYTKKLKSDNLSDEIKNKLQQKIDDIKIELSNIKQSYPSLFI